MIEDVILAWETFSTWYAGAGLATQMAVTFAVSVVASRIFAPNVPQAQQNNIRQQVPPDPTAGIPLVYGDAYTGGRFCDAVLTQDQKSMFYVMVISNISPNGQFIYNLPAAATPPTASQFYYSDQTITFDTTDQTKVVSLTDGAGNVDTSIMNDDGSSKLYIYLYTSSASGVITPVNTTLMPSDVMTYDPSNPNTCPSGQQWATTNRQMNGLAFAIIRLNYNNNSPGTTSLQPVTFYVSHYLNSTGCAKPGDVWYDYLTNPIYGGAVDPSFVSSASATALNTYSDQLINYIDSNGNPQTTPRYRFNGVLDTGQTVLSNIDLMMTCCDCWQAYQAATGYWEVVINQSITPSFAFDDTNIVGSITVGELDITQMINQIEAKFNDSTNRDQAGYVNLQTPANLIYQNEPVNKFTVSYDLVNNSVMAQYLANRTLEQNRLDLVVNFSTNYTGIQVNAGDVVTVTNSYYGWTNQQFRVMQVKEASLPDGSLGAALQLIAYDSNVYATSDITQYHPTPRSGLASPNFFSALTAPTVTAHYETANIPYFNVQIFIPVTGRVTNSTLYYTTVATPSGSDWKVWSNAQTANSLPAPNNTYYTFVDIVLPAATYYFAYTVGSGTSLSSLSPISAGFAWAPVGMSGVSGYSGASGYSGFSGSSGTGATGPRTATGQLYYANSSSTAPAAPTASGYNFSTGTFSSLTSGWSTTFTAPTATYTTQFWAATYYVIETTYGGAQTVTISTVYNWTNFNGLVSFTNLATSTGTTFINGGNIDTGTITASALNVTNLSAVSTNTGNLNVTGTFQANTAALSGIGMTGSGGVLYPTGYFAFGNSSSNITNSASGVFINGFTQNTAALISGGSIASPVTLLTFSVSANNASYPAIINTTGFLSASLASASSAVSCTIDMIFYLTGFGGPVYETVLVIPTFIELGTAKCGCQVAVPLAGAIPANSYTYSVSATATFHDTSFNIVGYGTPFFTRVETTFFQPLI